MSELAAPHAASGGDGDADAGDSVLPPVIRRLDESVVNRIAAGEVIQRPASAAKEVVENSLDAGARSVGVVVKDGGLKMLQITDDGHGIRPEDLSILCERHTTSKLRAFEDLESIGTMGFRGEALASLTYVSHVTVTTMTAGHTHGFRAQYRDGVMQGEAKPCAAIKGTQVLIEDLFFNVASRRKAFRSYSEEYARILDVISRFAIHHYRVCFSCKKFGEARTDLFTPGVPKEADGREAAGEQEEAERATEPAGTESKAREKGQDVEEEREQRSRHQQLEAIRAVYGTAVARDLVPVEARRGGWDGKGGKWDGGGGRGEVEDAVGGDAVRFSMRGFISSANYSAKKTTMVLFINDRLVECSPLRKACEATYAAVLPKASRPFLYLSLSLPPRHVDVNVHPTKKEVGFLNQDEIVAAVQQAVERTILSSNHTRTFHTQSNLLAASAPPPPPKPSAAAASANPSRPAVNSSPVPKHSSPASQRPPEHRLVRTDARIPAGRLHAFFSHRPASASQLPLSQPLSTQPSQSQQLPTQPSPSQPPLSHLSATQGSDPLLSAPPLESPPLEATGMEICGEVEEARGEDRGAYTGEGEGVGADEIGAAGRDPEGDGNREEGRAAGASGSEEAEAGGGTGPVAARSAAAVAAPAVAGSQVQLQAGSAVGGEKAAADSLAATRQAVRKRRSLKGAAGGAGGRGGGEERLTSVEELMEEISGNTHSALSSLVADCTYVGMVDDRRLLLQHSTSLYLVDVVAVSKQLMWQQAVRRFGQFTSMTLQPPPLVSDLLLLAVEEEERTGGWTPADGSKEEIVEASLQLLQCKAEMLLEYFSIAISPSGHLLSLPLLLDHHTPDLLRLPSFALALATQVEWDEEKACFESIAAALADLFAFHAPLLPRPAGREGDKEEGDGGGDETGNGGKKRKGREGDAGEGGVQEGASEEQVNDEGVSEEEVEGMWRQWEWSIQHVLLPALKFFLKPPKCMARDGSFIKVASLENLYKVFERC